MCLDNCVLVVAAKADFLHALVHELCKGYISPFAVLGFNAMDFVLSASQAVSSPYQLPYVVQFC